MALIVKINRMTFDRFTDNIDVDVYCLEEYADLPQSSARVTVPIINRDQPLSEIRIEAFQKTKALLSQFLSLLPE
jgi:hypothetical protein